MILIELIGLILVVTIMIIVFFSNRSKQVYKHKIIKELELKGLELVDVFVPKLFNRGPFKSSFNFLPPIEILGISIRSSFIYRKVIYKNNIGKVCESWVKIEISSLNEFVSIEWLPELQQK